MNAKIQRSMLALAGCGGVLVLGLIDWLTGHELNFFVFYFLPVAVAAWFLGLRYAIALSILSALTWYVANDLGGHRSSAHFYALWNTGIRLTAFLAIGCTVAHLRTLLDREREASTALRQIMSEIKVLEGILPICAQCKKIRNANGDWEQMEAYISGHSETRFSHGYCPECAARVREEAGLSAKPSRGEEPA